ncbi:hypothetical protein CB0940_04410 [Cercospora beticola]|uniref:Telomere length regulation protein conserved domain-containing protein n=1 Tax=Cercospora beticola TaxID=122368 RepID=A0A2G5HJP9_CERBT|nr:hypothetical protein CB0940_04410 [Cercospora beticola]PIA92750.1 hypothetical protein CB0940_04410 [Cercospora beticola]WPB01649.1 hypothetical protein RHO25_006279 [Cercospora beticola]
MADFLTAVKTTVANSSEELQPSLKDVSTRPDQKKAKPEVVVQPAEDDGRSAGSEPQTEADVFDFPVSPEQALQILRSEPNLPAVRSILEQLRSGQGLSSNFSIDAVGPQQAQLINAIVNTIIPNFWSALDKRDRKLLTSCLTNVAGGNAITARIRAVADVLLDTTLSTSGASELQDLLGVMLQLLTGEAFVSHVWQGLVKAVPDQTKRSMSWKEFINLIGSGKVVATIARAEDILSDVSDVHVKRSWISNASEYTNWLGRSITEMVAVEAEGSDEQANSQAAAQLLTKAFGLGYPVPLVKAILSYTATFARSSSDATHGFPQIIRRLPSFTKRQFLESTLQWLSQLRSSVPSGDGDHMTGSAKVVPSLAACIDLLVHEENASREQLLSFSADPTLLSTTSVPVRRAMVAVIAEALPDELPNVLERLITTFGDRLFINHAPIIHQEVIAQLLLLVAGYLHRQSPIAVLMTTRSSGHMSGTSNRLHSSNSRARWLGMVVATTISSLVDKEDARMNFETAEMQTEDAKWYQRLIKSDDKLGTLRDFDSFLTSRSAMTYQGRKPARSKELPIINGKQSFGPPRPPVQTEVIGEKVTELSDDEGEEDDELKPYAKPDSDPEDSDEDATLVNREKVRPPVYIRDLMRMLREDKKHGKFQVAIKHAASLIRKKSNFGREVTDHAEELGLLLCDLQDPFDTEDFDELKLQALMAVLHSDVGKIAPWLSRQAFSGDYSLSQRCIMLSALGLGGRELAGLRDQDDLNPVLPNTSFPSKKLPARLHAMYDSTSPPVKRLESASSSVEDAIMKPLALSAADQTTSHLNAVKIKKFSSRMDVERTKRRPAANQLAKIFATHFFNPLVTRYQQEIASYGQRSVFASAAIVQVTFVKTLALLLHAAGPATMGLPDVTTAFWELLLNLRVASANDISILESVLFALLTLLEVNCEWGNRARLAQEEPKRLAETQSWVEVVFERTGSGGLVTEAGGEEGKVRMLAAGVLVKCREVIEAYQKGIMGGLQSG